MTVYKTIVSSLCGLLILSGCSSGGTHDNKQDHDMLEANTSQINKLGSEQLPYIMGGTYDTSTAHPTSVASCLNVGVAGDFLINSPRATMTFDETQSLDEVLNALGVDAAVTVGWGPFAVTTSYDYAHSSQNNAYTLNFNYIYKYTGTAQFPLDVHLQGESALTPSAKAVLGMPEQFRQMCGDRFIEQMDAGASVLIRLQLQFWSEEDKDYYYTHLQKIKGLDNVLSIIAENQKNSRYMLTVSGLQVGGNPKLLTDEFESAGGSVDPHTGYATVNCSNDHGIASKCVHLIDQMITYPETIKNQLSDPSTYYLSNPVPATWGSIGVTPGDVNPSQASLAALRNITTLYNQDQSSLRFVNDYLLMLQKKEFLSATMQSDLNNLYTIIQQLLDLYSNPNLHIMDCYGGFVSKDCVNINNTLAAKRNQLIAQNQQAFNLLNYLRGNQYTSKLLIESNPYTESYCGLYPITSKIHGLFLVNCNGEVSGSLDDGQGLHITSGANNTLQVSNLNYTYSVESQESNIFKYQTSQALAPNPLMSNIYSAYVGVEMNGVPLYNNQHLEVVRRPSF